MAASVAALSSARLGEVIETSSRGFWAESERLHDHPPLGALVLASMPDGSANIGIVSFAQTGGLDPGRRAVRRGSEDLFDSAIYDRHPELEYVLRTLFQVTSVGQIDGLVVRHGLPPLPVPLHFSVTGCNTGMVQRFVQQPGYFAGLLRHEGDVAADDLLAAHLRWVDLVLDDGHLWLADATRRIASLMKRDYDRLAVILNSIDPG
jgi:hypothetical protein